MIAPYFCIGAVEDVPWSGAGPDRSPNLTRLTILINRVGKRFAEMISGLSHQTTL